MPHPNRSKYAAKHPPGTQLDERIGRQIADTLKDGKIECSIAHKIAATSAVEPSAVGIAIDLLEGRIVACQIGLFGYGDQKKAAKAADHVPTELQTLITKSLTDNRLTCSDAWRIAEEAGLSRLEVANACESLKIKIIRCQLGAF
jgi:hypothetical protein